MNSVSAHDTYSTRTTELLKGFASANMPFPYTTLSQTEPIHLTVLLFQASAYSMQV